MSWYNDEDWRDYGETSTSANFNLTQQDLEAARTTAKMFIGYAPPIFGDVNRYLEGKDIIDIDLKELDGGYVVVTVYHVEEEPNQKMSLDDYLREYPYKNPVDTRVVWDKVNWSGRGG